MNKYKNKQDAINPYGDKPLQVSQTFGTDISSSRFDDLDRSFLSHIINLSGPLSVVDLGCGLAFPSLAASLVGSTVYAYDNLDLGRHFSALTNLLQLPRFHYHRADLQSVEADAFPNTIDIVYTQRFIHYLPYADAERLLSILQQKMPSGSKLFISASGIGTELSRDTGQQTVDIRERYSRLSSEMAEKHDIHEPVCLYSEDDLSNLLSSVGFTPESINSSSFGNIKGIFSVT